MVTPIAMSVSRPCWTAGLRRVGEVTLTVLLYRFSFFFCSAHLDRKTEILYTERVRTSHVLY